jgi:hypothetical protein
VRVDPGLLECYNVGQQSKKRTTNGVFIVAWALTPARAAKATRTRLIKVDFIVVYVERFFYAWERNELTPQALLFG